MSIAEMTKEERLVLVETGGSIAWFAMDAAWMLGGRTAAIALAFPTVLLGLLVVRFVPRTWPSWLVSGAMVAWACMNVLWMVNDFKMIEWGLTASKACLVLGAVLIGIALLIARGEAFGLLAQRFRRLRLRA